LSKGNKIKKQNLKEKSFQYLSESSMRKRRSGLKLADNCSRRLVHRDNSRTLHKTEPKKVTKTRRAPRECKPPHRQAAIVNFVERHILCHKYFCRITKFGEDILNHGRAITSGRFSVRQFWPWPLKSWQQDIGPRFGADAEDQCQISWQQNFYLLRKTRSPPC